VASKLLLITFPTEGRRLSGHECTSLVVLVVVVVTVVVVVVVISLTEHEAEADIVNSEC